MQKMGNYYNSELNEYIGQNLPKIMTSIDADLFQLKFARKIIRIGEYKHDNEKLGLQQEKALKQLGKIARVINKNQNLFDGWTLQVVLIRGNKPYDKIVVTDFVNETVYTFTNKEKINDFLCVNQIKK